MPWIAIASKELTRQFNAFFPNNFEGSYAITNLQEIKLKNK